MNPSGPNHLSSPHQEAYSALLARYPTVRDATIVYEKSRSQPTLLLPIGISGSGKSTGFFKAQQVGWKILNSDEIRRNHLREMRARGEKMLVAGQRQTPNPDLPEHVFAAELRSSLPAWILSDFERALESGNHLILDITNLTLERVRYLIMARNAGYRCEAVLFPSLDLRINASRVRERGQSGGLDLVDPTKTTADSDRMQILQSLDANFWGYLSDLRQLAADEILKTPGPSSSDIAVLDFAQMKHTPGGLTAVLATSTPEQSRILRALAQQDCYNEIVIVPAPQLVPK